MDVEDLNSIYIATPNIDLVEKLMLGVSELA